MVEPCRWEHKYHVNKNNTIFECQCRMPSDYISNRSEWRDASNHFVAAKAREMMGWAGRGQGLREDL